MHLPKHHQSRGAGRQGKDSNPKSLSSLDFELAIWKRCMGGKHPMTPGLVRVRSIDSNPAISSDVVAKSRQQMIRARTESDIIRACPDRTSKNPAISSDVVAKSRQQMIRARTESDIIRASPDRTSKNPAISSDVVAKSRQQMIRARTESDIIRASPDRTSKNSTKIQRRFSSDSLFLLSNVTDNKDPDEKKEKGQQHAGFDSPSTKQSVSRWVGIEFISLVLWPISAVLAVLNKTMMRFSHRFQLSSTRARTCRGRRALARREVYEAARDMQLHRGKVQVALAEFRRSEERYIRANEDLQELEVSLQVRPGFGGV
jgi:hypothetical protein